MPSASGNFWKDMRRLLGFLWTGHKKRKNSNRESKWKKRLKKEFYK